MGWVMIQSLNYLLHEHESLRFLGSHMYIGIYVSEIVSVFFLRAHSERKRIDEISSYAHAMEGAHQ